MQQQQQQQQPSRQQQVEGVGAISNLPMMLPHSSPSEEDEQENLHLQLLATAEGLQNSSFGQIRDRLHQQIVRNSRGDHEAADFLVSRFVSLFRCLNVVFILIAHCLHPIGGLPFDGLQQDTGDSNLFFVHS